MTRIGGMISEEQGGGAHTHTHNNQKNPDTFHFADPKIRTRDKNRSSSIFYLSELSRDLTKIKYYELYKTNSQHYFIRRED
jgi:hypothetical protein